MFNETNSLIEHLVYIDNHPIVPAQILDLALQRSIDTIVSYGTITFVDKTNLYSRLPIDRDSKIQLYFTDHYKTNFNNSSYRIMKVEETRSDKMAENIVTIFFVDTLYYNATQAYISKGFKEKTLHDIATALIGEVEKTFYETDFSTKDDFIYKELTTPRNKNILQVIKKLCNDRGLFFYRTKMGMKIKHITEMTSLPIAPRASYKETYQMRDLNRIISKETKSSTLIDNLVDIPEAKSFRYDIETKSVIPTNIQKEKIYKDYEIESKIRFITNEKQNQEKYIYNVREDDKRTKKEYGDLLLDNVGIELMVNGNFMVDAGSMVEVTIFDTNPDKIDNEYKPLTGKYLVHTCIDKISTGFFVQKLILMRADEKE